MLRLPPGLPPLLLNVLLDPSIQRPARRVIQHHDRRQGSAPPVSNAPAPACCLLCLLACKPIASNPVVRC